MAKTSAPETLPRWLCKACLDAHQYRPRETRARLERTCAHCGDCATVFLVRTSCPTCHRFSEDTRAFEAAIRGWATRRRNERARRRLGLES